ncbi:uncharacterized protein LOC102481642 [Tupaia chinensis]|uniref:uncharacterized protein LOC102481642 n=1 Tax=Tupaia chinensis TaxID=246437 RepID=UPI000FFC30CA|nr:uncharacterized protein LOC102481642 [Tupaia chinensis]
MQLWFFQDLLQGLSATDLQVLGRGGDPKSGAKAIARTDSGQHEEPQGGHTTAAPGECGQPPPGGTPSVSLLGFQPELNRAIAALASALSRSRRTPAGVSRKASGHLGGQLLSTCQQDELVTDRPLSSSNEERQNARLPQDPGLPQLLQGEAKGGSTEDPSPEKWIRRPRQRHGAIPELQRKIKQVEDSLDVLNKEFLQLTAQALELQKEDKPGRPSPAEGDTTLVTPSIFAHPAEACGPYRENPKTRALKSDQDLLLEVRRVHLAQRIEDLEWELSLLLQVADGRSSIRESWPHHLASLRDTESHRTLLWPPARDASSTKNTTGLSQ